MQIKITFNDEELAAIRKVYEILDQLSEYDIALNKDQYILNEDVMTTLDVLADMDTNCLYAITPDIHVSSKDCNEDDELYYHANEFLDSYKTKGSKVMVPKYKEGDNVEIELDNQKYIGEIYIVDAHGIFGDNTHIYYDIMLNGKSTDSTTPTLLKHVREDTIKDLNGD